MGDLVNKCIVLSFIFAMTFIIYSVENWSVPKQERDFVHFTSQTRIRSKPFHISSSQTKHFKPLHVLPHAIIIGAKKCGTYALKDIMDDIYPTVRAMKGEPSFFSLHYSDGIRSYIKSLPAMKSPKDIVIEKSPNYIEHSNVPFRIHKESPKSKLIFIV